MAEMDSAKVKETKENIMKAYLKLYQTKGIEKMNVKEIMSLAGYNRGTFYVYYLDIYDLAEQVEAYFFETVEVYVHEIIDKLFSGADISNVLPPKEYFVENRDLLYLVFGERANPLIIAKAKRMAQRYVAQKVHLDLDIPHQKRDYVLEYVAGGQVAILTHWYKNDMDMSIPELAKLLRDVNFRGPLRFIFSLSKRRSS